MTPPSYLQEKLDDLIRPSYPRLVVLTHRTWMEPYYSLEESELDARHTVQLSHYVALVLWLRQIRLFLAAFSNTYDWSRIPDREVRQSTIFRFDLLGLSGSNFKVVLDTLMAGYYGSCLALERHMLETWRRVAYARLSSNDIWRWYPKEMWPDDIMDERLGTIPKGIPDAKTISEKIQQFGTDRDKTLLSKVSQGFKILNDHAHPTIEGTTQTWDAEDSGRRVFGANFSDLHCRRCLTWGLSAGMMLLDEVALIDPQGDDWISELNSLDQELAQWLQDHQY